MAQPSKFCIHCGSQIDSRAEICPKCGVRVAPPPPSSAQFSRKDPTTAAILSFLITGIGQIYIGQIGRGLAFLIGGILAGFMFGLIFSYFGVVLALCIPIASAYDAYSQAKKYNEYYEQYGKPLW